MNDRETKRHRTTWRAVVALAAASACSSAAPASAQLDPLLFVKRVPPTVVIVFDTSFRMLDDGAGNYHDPRTYTVAGDTVATPAGVTGGVNYRRIYRNLRFVSDETSKYEADTVVGIADNTEGYRHFWAPTRFEIARTGVYAAVRENAGSPTEEAAGTAPRWGLVRLRQSSPVWSNTCDRPVNVTADEAFDDVSDSACPAAGNERLGVFAPQVASASYANTGAAPAGTIVADPAAALQNKASYVLPILQKSINASPLVPAGRDGTTYQDRPLRLALVDALARATAAVGADGLATKACRNTVVVLVTGGQDDGDEDYRRGDVGDQAAEFISVNTGAGHRRMPIFVIGVKPASTDEPELQEIATNSGGRYFRATSAADVTRAVNLAVQAAYSNAADFDTSSPSEYAPVTPVVGTVNLEKALAADGRELPDTLIRTNAGARIPQRSNVIITAGFSLGGPTAGAGGGPGFEGRVRAFRSFRPERDEGKTVGYKFVQDGTPLWPVLYGEPGALAGIARTPPDPDSRNVFTYLPGSGVVPLTAAYAEVLRPHLAGADPATLIPFVRSLPIGAVVGSTPALMDPPSLTPPPDADYGMPDADNDATYAGRLRHRRAVIWFGANDGMIHGVDARTGYEVWAFVPFNLLPKLKTLIDGQPVHQFEYFVDSSPKIAEVKLDGRWRSILMIGQGPGGTFYQAFDVTEAGMGVAPALDRAPDAAEVNAVLATFADPDRVSFLWAFPSYDNFDTTVAACPDGNTTALPCRFSVTDATPGGTVRLYGDLEPSASAVEKSVGFTWSDPAVGPLNPDRSTNVAIVGSGYFPDIEAQLPGRVTNGDVVKAGRTFYLIDLETGRVLGDPANCNAGIGCRDVGDLPNPPWRNALQADPTAAGTPGSYVVQKAYLGDLDGRYWRFTFNQAGAISASPFDSIRNADLRPIYNSSALLMLGTTQQYVFFSTGSDLLPRVAAAGGNNPVYRLYGIRDLGNDDDIMFSHALAWPANGRGTILERPSSAPSVAGDIVFFTTTLEDTAANIYCTSEAVQSRLYAFTFTGDAAYSTNDREGLDPGDSVVVRTVSGRATAPFIVDQHLYFATSGPQGPNLEVFGHPEDFNNGVGQVGVRILSWRELR